MTFGTLRVMLRITWVTWREGQRHKRQSQAGMKGQNLESGPWVDFWWMNIWIVGCGRGGGIESAGGNYPLKLPPQLPTVSGRAQQCGCVMRKRGISTPSLFPLLPPSRPLLYEANRRRDQRRRNITHHYNPMQLKPSGRRNCATIQSLLLQRRRKNVG